MKKKLFAITAVVSCLTFSGVNAFASPVQIAKAEHKHEHAMKQSLMPTAEIVADGVKFKFYVFNIDNINKSLKADKQSYFYSCSMHPYVTSENPGTCPICGGMKLEKTEKTSSLLSTKEGNLLIKTLLYDTKTDGKISEAKVKLKIIEPDKKEQEKMMNYDMGSFGSSFSINQKGKYGVITLVKIGDKSRVARFYYENN